MGYETKLQIGTVSKITNEDGKHHFHKIAMIDLCKCGYEGALPDLIRKVTNKDSEFTQVYLNSTYEVNKRDVVKSIFGKHNFQKGIKKEYFLELLGESEADVKENINKIASLFEEWGHEVIEDNYGATLKVVPIEDVYKAMLLQNAKELIEEGETYRRYDIALATLKAIMDSFSTNLFCVFFGY